YDGEGSFVAYKDTASYYQPMAGWALVQIGDATSIPRLKQIALDRTRPHMARSAALLAYARLAKTDAVADLHKVLEQPDDRLAQGSWATYWTGPERPLAFPSFHGVRDAAAWALADIGGDAARDAMNAYLDSGQPLSFDLASAAHRLAPMALENWSRNHIDKEP